MTIEFILCGMRGFFPGTDEQIKVALESGLASGRFKLFIEGQAAFCLLTIPQTPFDYPQVLHFYSEKPALRRALVGQVLDFVRESGYNKLQAVNGSKLDNEMWTRAFRHPGWEIKPVKTVFEFEVVK